MSAPRVLVVEAEEDALALVEEVCRHWKMAFDVVERAEDALEQVGRCQYGLVLSAVGLPGMSGVDLVRHIKRRQAELPVVLLAEEPKVVEAVRAVKGGASDYLDKPLSREALELSVSGLLHLSTAVNGKPAVVRDGHLKAPANGLVQEGVFAFGKTVESERPERLEVGRMLTANKMMVWAISHALSLADVHAPVLLEGEPGVGKRLIARQIHRRSRCRGPFVQVSCTALAEYLLASELFGHVRGAFSGANRDRRGKLEAANEGVLFVDGIAEASLALQRRLLRVLEDGVIERVGEGHPISVDVKMVVATNSDLAELVWDGKFCEPLYHRLNVAKVKVPPLRHRKDDIPILTRAFLEEFRKRHSRGPKDVSQACLKTLEDYSWPGNVTELESVVQTAASLCPDGVEVISTEHLPTMLTAQPTVIRRAPVDGSGGSTSLSHLLQQRERTFVEQALVATDYNIQHSAKLLHISRPTLYAKMKRFGLSRAET